MLAVDKVVCIPKAGHGAPHFPLNALPTTVLCACFTHAARVNRVLSSVAGKARRVHTAPRLAFTRAECLSNDALV